MNYFAILCLCCFLFCGCGSASDCEKANDVHLKGFTNYCTAHPEIDCSECMKYTELIHCPGGPSDVPMIERCLDNNPLCISAAEGKAAVICQ